MRSALAPAWAHQAVAEYERLRAFALGTAHAPGFGWVVFLRQGMRAWGETCRPLASSP